MLGKIHWPMETPAEMSQLRHAEEDVGEDSLANGDPPEDRRVPATTCSGRLTGQWWPCKHVPATTCSGRLTGQWWPPCRPCPSYNMLRKMLGKTHWPMETPWRQTCPSYNMLRKMLGKTHWPMETPLKTDVSQLLHAQEDSLASGDPASMSQLQHAQEDVGEDSLANGDPPEDRRVPATTCSGRLTGQWWPCRPVLATTCSGRLIGRGRWWEDSLASGHPSADISQLHWTCWGRLTGQWRPLQTCPSYNMLRKTHWPVMTLQTYSSYMSRKMVGRLISQWRPPLQKCPSYNMLRKMLGKAH